MVALSHCAWLFFRNNRGALTTARPPTASTGRRTIWAAAIDTVTIVADLPKPTAEEQR
jgi:hypothetical protein